MQQTNTDSDFLSDNVERKMYDLVMQAPIAITILRGPDFIVELANDNYLQMVDRTAARFIGFPLMEALPELKGQSVGELLTGVLLTGKPFHGNEFLLLLNRHGHKAVTYFNFVYQPLRERDGVVSGVMVMATDVTNQVEAKQALAESETQFRNVVMESPIAMCIFRGPDWVIEMANQTLLNKIWRRSLVEVEGKRLMEVFPELEGQQFPGLLRSVAKTGLAYKESEAVAFVNTRSGMMKYYLDFEYAPLYGSDGYVSGIMVTVSDVTERVAARQQLEEAEARLRMAAEATGLGTWDLDLQTDGLIYSAQLVQLFGFPPEKVLVHMDVQQKIHPDDQLVVMAALDKAFRTGIYFYEVRIVWPDGSIHWIRTQGKLVYVDGVPVRLLGTVMDITQSKELEVELERRVRARTQELLQLNARLETSNNELEQYAYIASHDLQEPLRKIRTYSGILNDRLGGKIDGSLLSSVQKIMHSAERMSDLIYDLLNFSRLLKPEKLYQVTDLNLVLANIINDFELTIAQKQAQVVVGLLPEIEAVPLQMNQLFYNLVNNALKFGKEDVTSSIVIGVAPLTDLVWSQYKELDPGGVYVDISVADNGIGFEQQYADQIFEVFKRLHNNHVYPGSGIGLSLCRKIVLNHDGVIYAEGVPEKGSVFHVILPLKQKVS